ILSKKIIILKIRIKLIPTTISNTFSILPISRINRLITNRIKRTSPTSKRHNKIILMNKTHHTIQLWIKIIQTIRIIQTKIILSKITNTSPIKEHNATLTRPEHTTTILYNTRRTQTPLRNKLLNRKVSTIITT
ncbi:hypothetical protein EB061_12160, partial [bacterium]|nr:hypothetical protein [bacterium]